MRGWKSFDSLAFSVAIRDSLLYSPGPALDTLTVGQLIETCISADTTVKFKDSSSTIGRLVRHTPTVINCVTAFVAWSDAFAVPKILAGCDSMAWIAQLRALHRLYHCKEATHWEEVISRNARNTKRSWSSISDLLGRSSRASEIPTFSINDFLAMLTEKTDRLRASISNATFPTFASTSPVFDAFHPYWTRFGPSLSSLVG